MQNKLLLILIALIIALSPTLSAQTNAVVYISANGLDSNTGTLEKPFKTLLRAKQEVRKLKKTTRSNIFVMIGAGTYEIEQTLVFTPEDGGEGTQTVTYQAASSEQVIISGGKLVSNFNLNDKKLFEKKVISSGFRELYNFEGSLTRARQPNTGEFFRLQMWDKERKELYIKAEEIEGFENTKGLEMKLIMNWALNTQRVKTVNFTNKEKSNWTNPRYARIKFADPEDSLLYARDYPPKRPDLPYFFENSFTFLDTPHEWFFDAQNQMLYVKPDKYDQIGTFSVIVPVLDTLIVVSGTDSNPVKNLHFSGITFSYNTWNGPSAHGFSHIQSGNFNLKGTGITERIPSSVYVYYGHNIQFTNNNFCNLAATALDLHIGAQNCIVEGNIFYNVGGNGIAAGKYSEGSTNANLPYVPANEAERNQFNVIRNNYLNQVSNILYGTVAIAVGYANDITIEHNTIEFTPYTGISIGWGWTPLPNAMKNNIIRRNKISNVCTLLCDCGGIYTLSAQPNSVVAENAISNIKRSKWACSTSAVGLYADEGTTGYIFEENSISEVIDEKTKYKGDVQVKFNCLIKPDVEKIAGLQEPFVLNITERFKQLMNNK